MTTAHVHDRVFEPHVFGLWLPAGLTPSHL